MLNPSERRPLVLVRRVQLSSKELKTNSLASLIAQVYEAGRNVEERQVARLLPGDDLCGFSGGNELGGS